MTKSRTYIASPPGFTIKEQLVDHDMSQKEFAARMGYSEKHISQLLKGDVGLTAETADRLESVLGVPAHFWNNLECIYREKLQKVENENQMDADIELARQFPYAEMAKLEWVPSTRKRIEKVNNLRQFFEVASLGFLDIDESLLPIACRRQGKTIKADFALMAWAQQARREARDIEAAKINLRKLEASLPEIREMTNEDPSIFGPRLVEQLASCGIALVYLPHLEGSYLSAATFRSGSRIVIGLTVRGRYADIFWFSLCHEIGHILCGHIDDASSLSDDEEEEADNFAANMLIPGEKYKAFRESGELTEARICEFAKSVGVDPGIVVGRLQKEGVVPYHQFNQLRQVYAIVDEENEDV